MNKVFFFGVIETSSHEMWLDESTPLLALPSVEYMARQQAKKRPPGTPKQKKVRDPNAPTDEDVCGWIIGKDSCVLMPWPIIDSVLCPGIRKRFDDRALCDVRERDQVEGQFALHHRDGWTALAWWDRSGRNGFWSNAGLYAQGTFTADEMLAMGAVQFPNVMRRMKYDFVPGVFSVVTKANTSVVIDSQDFTVPKRSKAKTRDALESSYPTSPPVMVVFFPPDLFPISQS